MKKKPWNSYSNTLKFRKTYLEQQLDKQTTNTSIMQPDIFLTVKHQRNVSDICAICSQKPIRQAPAARNYIKVPTIFKKFSRAYKSLQFRKRIVGNNTDNL
jgi:hypothetical protein